jgi:hypothetical protein
MADGDQHDHIARLEAEIAEMRRPSRVSKGYLLSKVAIADKGIWIGLFGSGEHAGGHIARVQNDY